MSRSGFGDLAGCGIDGLGGGLVLLRPFGGVSPPPSRGLLETVAVAVHGQDMDMVG